MTTSPTTPPITSVSGGAGGIEARYDDVERLAALFDASGDGLRRDAWDDKGLALNGDLLESAILSPASFVEAESAVLAATIGPSGLAFRAVGLEADALSMQVAVGLLRTSDELSRQAMEALDYTVGRALGASLPILGLAGLLGGTALVVSNPVLAGLLATYLATHPELADEALTDVEGFLEDHPDLVQHLVNGGGGLLDGLLGDLPSPLREALLDELGIDPFHGTPNDAAGDLAGLFGEDGDVEVRRSDGVDDLTTPGSLEELLTNLELSNAEGADGEIDIQQIGQGADARYIVHLPGTDDWVGDPDDVRDLQSNLQLVGGQDTAYTRGILAAMAEGIPPGAPVMLVGHSQGGMAAVHLAADSHFQDAYDVRHVVTAGSPTAQVDDIPPGTRVLSLENSGDVVPLTDGEDNPDQPNRTTVVFDGRTGSVAGNHDPAVYVQGAAAVDASSEPSLLAELASLREDGFLGNEGTTTNQGYTIERGRR